MQKQNMNGNVKKVIDGELRLVLFSVVISKVHSNYFPIALADAATERSGLSRKEVKREERSKRQEWVGWIHLGSVD